MELERKVYEKYSNWSLSTIFFFFLVIFPYSGFWYMVLVFRDIPLNTCDWEQDVDSWDSSFSVRTGKMQKSLASLLRLVHHLIRYVTVFWEGYKYNV